MPKPKIKPPAGQKAARPLRSEPKTELARWLAENKIPQTALAAYLGVNERTVRRYCEGSRDPVGPAKKMISEFTNGAVTYDDGESRATKG